MRRAASAQLRSRSTCGCRRGVSRRIVAGKRAITPETALQQAYDLRKVEVELGAKVRAEVSPVA